jgi:hypothetical protein
MPPRRRGTNPVTTEGDDLSGATVPATPLAAFCTVSRGKNLITEVVSASCNRAVTSHGDQGIAPVCNGPAQVAPASPPSG